MGIIVALIYILIGLVVLYFCALLDTDQDSEFPVFVKRTGEGVWPTLLFWPIVLPYLVYYKAIKKK